MKKSRIPFFCEGCPHIFTYKALFAVLKDKKDFVVNGDIGCYELAGFGNNVSATDSDFDSIREIIDTLFVMGSSVSVSQGMIHAGFKGKVLTLIGDSTFFHCGLQGFINALGKKLNMLCIIFDNRCTAMTGQQSNPSELIDIESLLRTIGFKNVATLDPYKTAEFEEKIREFWELQDTAVIISKAACVQLKRKKAKGEKR